MGKSGGIVLRHDDGQNGASIRDYNTSKRATDQCPVHLDDRVQVLDHHV